MDTAIPSRSRRASQGGFTLLELMSVLAIVSILVVVAVPMYQRYALRAQLTEGIGALGALKTSLVDQYYSDGTFPANNSEAGLPDTGAFRSKSVESVSVQDGGVIELRFSLSELGSANGLQLVPCVESGIVAWSCRAADTDGVAPEVLPSSCKQEVNVASCGGVAAAAATARAR